MLGPVLLLASAATLAAMLYCCSRPKTPCPPVDEQVHQNSEPPYNFRVRPTRPALDHSIYLRY